MEATAAQDRRLAAIAAASAVALRSTEYRKIRTQDVAARVCLDGAQDRRSAGGARSAVWLYNEVRSRRVLVALGARHAWIEHLARTAGPGSPTQVSTVADTVATVVRLLEQIVRFHQTERFLVEQAAAGLGDIATSEKAVRSHTSPAPQWPGSAWGRLAESAYSGRCTLYADFLAPGLLAAARGVVPLPPAAAAAQAAALSDLVFRGLAAAGPDGPTERVAAGFAAYWFERELVPVAGSWVRDLYAAELALEAAAARDTDPRAGQSARGALIRILMDADTLHARCAREGAARADALRRDLDLGPARLPGPADGTEPADLRALCDAASRQGLALFRLGEVAQAVAAFETSRTVAAAATRLEPAESRSFAARADHNLAEAAMSLGDQAGAVEACERAFAERAARLEPAGPGARPLPRREAAAAWRRYALTAEARARITAWTGRPVAAVALAEDLVRRGREQPGRDHGTALRLRGALAQVLLEAGHPLEARHHLEAVRLSYLEDPGEMAVNLGEYRERLRLARALMMFGEPQAAQALLPDEDTLAWCAGHVSFTAAAEARRLRALAWSGTGRHEEAAALAQVALADLRARAGDGPRTVLIADLEEAGGVVALRAGDAQGALAVFESVLARRLAAPGARFDPGAAASMLWLGRAADALGESARACANHGDLAAAAAGILEPTHPVLIEAGLDQAERLLRAGEFDAASRLVEAAIDDSPLAHGRPAVEKGHPLRTRARALAGVLGVPAARPRPSYDED
jgi:tetratricopeptide (TPR) repeat protein